MGCVPGRGGVIRTQSAVVDGDPMVKAEAGDADVPGDAGAPDEEDGHAGSAAVMRTPIEQEISQFSEQRGLDNDA
eukprot:12921864-Prorocentrum_lima.AAC.1